MNIINEPIARRLPPQCPAASDQPEALLSEVLEACARIGTLARGPRHGENTLLANRLFLEADAQINQGQITAYMMLVMVAKSIQKTIPVEGPEAPNGGERRRFS